MLWLVVAPLWLLGHFVVDVQGCLADRPSAFREKPQTLHSFDALHNAARHQLDCRGGDISEKDADDTEALDAYIEELIASVEKDDNNEEEQERTDEVVAPEEEADEIETKVSPEVVEDTKDQEEKVEVDDEEIKASKNTDVDEKDLTKEEEDTLLDAAPDSLVDKPDYDDESTSPNEAPGSETTLEESAKEKEEPEKTPSSAETSTDDLKRSLTPVPQRRIPPHPILRFFLRQGRIGHAIVMILLAIRGFVERYLPPVEMLLASVFSALPSKQRRPPRPGDFDYVEPSTVNEQYAGFVKGDGTSVRGKNKRAARKKADQKATEKLKQIGSISQSKYRHLSQRFMERHGIGGYAAAPDTAAIAASSSHGAVFNEEDDDSAWVVETLTKPSAATKPKRKKKRSVNDVSTVVGVSSTGEMEVGVSFSIAGKSNKRKKRRKDERTSAVLEAVHSESTRRKKRVGPRISDREGGVMGRLRDLSANNLMSRKVSGAYPGDAVSPSEAASSSGVIELAMKYGFGEWSDDEEEVEDDVMLAARPKRRRRRKVSSTRRGTSSSSSLRSTKRRRKKPSRTSSGGGTSDSASFEFGGFPSSSTRQSSVSPKRSSATRSSPSSILSSESSSSKKTRKRRDTVLVQPPMERLNAAKKRLQDESL